MDTKQTNPAPDVPETFRELVRSLSEKELNSYFNDKIQRTFNQIGSLSIDELTLIQERVNVLVEIREEFISIRNQDK